MKNVTNLSFNYNAWACCINKDQVTSSIAKMKKIIKDDIKHCLINGYKKHGERESRFYLSIPFLFPMYVVNEMNVKIVFGDECTFRCEKFSNQLKSRKEHGEISCSGQIFITIEWRR